MKNKKKYEIQFSTNPMLKNEIKKIKLKKEQKQPKLIWVNMLNSQPRLWDDDNLLKTNKKITKLYFLQIQCWRLKLRKKN